MKCGARVLPLDPLARLAAFGRRPAPTIQSKDPGLREVAGGMIAVLCNR